MSKPIIFIQVHGRPGILEAELSETATLGELHDALASRGIEIDAATFIFIDEGENHQHGDRQHRVDGVKHGSRIHVSRCKRIKTTVHFLDKTAEHVLQICNSTKRPPSDTPLHELVDGHGCALCFDFVPEKRVEG